MKEIRGYALFVMCMALSGCGSDHRRSDAGDEDGAVIGGDGDGGRTAVDAAGIDGAVSGDAAAPDGALTGDGASPTSDGASADGGVPFTLGDGGHVLCGTAPCACADGVDGDGDGLIDLADPECVSSWDNDEASFATGIPGDNRDDACQDCFFDGNSGSGNDGCRIPSSCLTTGTPSSGQGSCNSCAASQECKSYCQAYTPNGCDCFGCCTVQLGSGITKNVLIGSGCNIDGSNTSGCTECVPSTTCNNACGECELCPGKTLADLPASCANTGTGDGGVGATDGGTGSEGDGGVAQDGGSTPVQPVPSCDLGEQQCGAGLPACASAYLCQFGCCILTPLL